MTQVFSRILELKNREGFTWDKLAELSGIQVSSWMTGVDFCQPTDSELRKIAPTLKTTYEYLKTGAK